MKNTFVLIAFLISSTGFAQTKQPITHEVLWLMKRVGPPSVSPDGKWVVFSVQEPAYDEKEIVNDLWLVPADGSVAPRRITTNKSGETGYAWSPDSKQVAFVAKRDGEEVAQIYLLNLKDGGEAQKFTNVSTGAGAPQWSPDGKTILFTSSVFPGVFTDSANKKLIDEKKNLKYKARVYTSFPIRNWDHWLDEKQTHLFIQSTDPGSKMKDLFKEVDFVSGAGFEFKNACWTADSRSVIFSALDNANTAAYHDVATHLYKVDTAGGDALVLFNDSLNSYSKPAVSPDGKYLYCIESAENNYKVYNLGKLVRYDWPSMQNKTVLAATVDRPINSYAVSAKGIVMSVEDEARDRLLKIDNGSITAEVISPSIPASYTNPATSADGSVIVSDFETAASPAEIVRINSNDKAHHPLSSFNTEKLRNLDLVQTEDVWFTSSRGKKIHSLLIKPAGFDSTKKYPLFVMIHGGPATAIKHSWSFRWNYHLLTKPGYILLAPNYTGSTSFGEKFSQDIQFDPFKGPGDEINEAAANAIKKFSFIDSNRQAAGGGSYGGHLANWLEATTTHYKCLISHAGLVNSEVQWGTSDGIYHREVMNGGTPWMQTKSFKEQNPISLAANFKTPMLVTIGENDFRVPLNNALENWSALQRMRVPSKLIVFPEENHWILKGENSKYFYQQVQEWLKTYLK